MKKKIISIAFVLISCLGFAQCPIEVGQAQLNAGVGFSSWGIPVYLGFDYGVHKDITIGAEASFRSYNHYYKSYRYSNTIIGISGNANYHFNHVLEIPTKWDLYAGLNIGFYYWDYPEYYYAPRASGLGVGAQIGGRYYVSKKIGINLEFGGGNAFSGGKFGVSFKL